MDKVLSKLGDYFTPEASEQQHKRNLELAQASSAPMMAMFQLLMAVYLTAMDCA
jgi:hypothetical protein